VAKASVKANSNYKICPMRLKLLEANSILNELSASFFVNFAVPAGAVEVRVPCVELRLPLQVGLMLSVVPK
jgi:hypothetical protein